MKKQPTKQNPCTAILQQVFTDYGITKGRQILDLSPDQQSALLSDLNRRFTRADMSVEDRVRFAAFIVDYALGDPALSRDSLATFMWAVEQGFDVWLTLPVDSDDPQKKVQVGAVSRSRIPTRALQ